MSATQSRLSSIDALRGCTVAAMLLVNDPGLDDAHTYWPLEHASWNGCTPTDLIFPFFLFIVGVSTALAFQPKLEQGVARAKLIRGAMVRALRIVLLGLALHLLDVLLTPGEVLRIPGVLQRIGLCFAGVSLFAVYAKPRTWWIAIVVLLLGYWGLLLAGGTTDRWVNIVDRVDTAIFGQHVYQLDTGTGRGHDPEGLLSTLSSLATTLLGLCAGTWLRHKQLRKLLVAGAIAMLIAWTWSYWLPFNKNLWTSSFALWTAGCAMLATWVFHYLVDERGWLPLGRRFGVNAVAAYAGAEAMQSILPATGLQDRIEAWLNHAWAHWQFDPRIASLAYAVAFVLFWWVIVLVMDRRRIYVKL
jgi:predicted acyltransferase